ncbi:MAG: hypothetical protein Q8L41_06150 [Anaerolineales bacterium]|nr:hypothetical protein [Anaerolineales bacterium]MDP2778328.1 hypothetical protein [Anaerolineales bacterium]
MGKKHGKPLKREDGENILKLFKSKPEWEPTEVPWDSIRGLALARREDTLAIWISGSTSNSQLAQGVNAIAGIDVLTIETNPNIQKNESPGNAYHYILKKINNKDFPFLLLGPFDEGTIIPHWFDDKDLDVYKNME